MGRPPIVPGSLTYLPAWSADGSRIYFRFDNGGTWEVDWVAPGGGATTKVAGSQDIDPAPSPDGLKLAYYQIGAGIEISSPDGALPLLVPGVAPSDFELSWQPVTVYTVTTAADSDDGGVCGTTCSLRNAITAANAHPGHEIINFAIPGGGTPHIVVATGTLNALPAISAPVTIDGSSGGAPAVELSPATSGFEGLDVTSGSTTIRGLIIHGFSAQIRLDSGDANTVAGNWVGLDASAASTADQNGIVLDASSDNTIGGTSAADRNVIDTQFPIAGDAASNNIIEGNYIGVDPTGATQVGSVDPGISFDDGGGDNTIGGTVPGSANVIASGDDAIDLGSNDNTVEGNSIGTNHNETQVIGVDIGVSIEGGATGNTIGGTSAAAGNVIAGVHDTAFLVTAGGNTFEGNFIGTDRSGSAYSTVNEEGVRQENYTSASANLYANNLFENSEGYGLQIASSTATISGNTITGSGDVAVDLGEASGVKITQNSIYDNGFPGIYYEGGNGPGARTSQMPRSARAPSRSPGAFRLLRAARPTTSRSSAARGSCSGATEGETYLGTIAVTGNGGTTSFDSTVPVGGSGTAFTATATDPTLSTSEFSNCVDASSSGGTLSASESQTVAAGIDLTATGTDDWAVWGYGTSTTLTPAVRKVNGSGISDLSPVGASSLPPRAYGGFPPDTVPFTFDWSDGSPTHSDTNAVVGLAAPQAGTGFSFTVPADTTPRTLTIWTSAHYADGTLEASLSDGSAQPFSYTVDAVPSSPGPCRELARCLHDHVQRRECGTDAEPDLDRSRQRRTAAPVATPL